MRICKNCNSKIEEDALVCPYCGCVTKRSTKKQKAQDAHPVNRSMNDGSKTPKKGNIWMWIFGWICIFPIPLTILMLRSKKINKIVKIAVIVISWLIYLSIASFGPGDADKTEQSKSLPADVETMAVVDKVPEPINIESIELVGNTNDLIIGETTSVQAVILPANADNKIIKWTSSDKSVATVDKIGNITAVSGGTATITAAAGDGISDSIDVSVDGTKALLKLHVNHTREDDVNIGDEWSYNFQLNGERVMNTADIAVGDNLSFYAEITESDEKPDVGSASSSHMVTEDDLKNGFEVKMDVYVTENGGRNSGKSAHFVVTYTFLPNN